MILYKDKDATAVTT